RRRPSRACARWASCSAPPLCVDDCDQRNTGGPVGGRRYRVAVRRQLERIQEAVLIVEPEAPVPTIDRMRLPVHLHPVFRGRKQRVHEDAKDAQRYIRNPERARKVPLGPAEQKAVGIDPPRLHTTAKPPRHEKPDRANRMERALVVAIHITIGMLAGQCAVHALRPLARRVDFLGSDVLTRRHPQALAVGTKDRIKRLRHYRTLLWLSLNTSCDSS